jgi:hypothetical protein
VDACPHHHHHALGRTTGDSLVACLLHTETLSLAPHSDQLHLQPHFPSLLPPHQILPLHHLLHCVLLSWGCSSQWLTVANNIYYYTIHTYFNILLKTTKSYT